MVWVFGLEGVRVVVIVIRRVPSSFIAYHENVHLETSCGLCFDVRDADGTKVTTTVALTLHCHDKRLFLLLNMAVQIVHVHWALRI
jgi:hypothetical protein